MKGLDDIQGSIYVRIECVFRRQALYGYDAPVAKKLPRKTCNCWPRLAILGKHNIFISTIIFKIVQINFYITTIYLK